MQTTQLTSCNNHLTQISSPPWWSHLLRQLSVRPYEPLAATQHCRRCGARAIWKSVANGSVEGLATQFICPALGPTSGVQHRRLGLVVVVAPLNRLEWACSLWENKRRTSSIAVDVGTDLIQCQIFFEGYDMQQAVLNQPVQCKQVGSSDFELPDGAIVPTMDLIRECKSSLPPGLTHKWDPDALDAFFCNKQDAIMGRLPRTSIVIFTGLGLPHYDQNYDQNEEVLLWRNGWESDEV